MADMVRRRLIALRVARRFTQKQVADAVGWTQGTMSSYERGHFAASLDTLEVLANFYGVTLAWLVKREGPTAPPPLSAPQVVNDFWVRLPPRKQKLLMELLDSRAGRARNRRRTPPSNDENPPAMTP